MKTKDGAKIVERGRRAGMKLMDGVVNESMIHGDLAILYYAGLIGAVGGFGTKQLGAAAMCEVLRTVWLQISEGKERGEFK